MPLGIAGEEHLATSDDFLDLETLPRRIVLVGGGYIAFEFAHIVRRAGAEVVVLEQGSRFLSPFDQDLVGWLVGKSRKQIGRESCRERVGTYVSLLVVAVSFKKKNNNR